MHYVLDIKSTQIIQSCNIPLKLNQIIQNPTHATHPQRHAQIRGLQIRTFSYAYTYIQIHPTYTHKKRLQIHLQLNYSVHVTMLHGNMVNTPTNTPISTLYGSITLSPQKGPPSPGRGGGGSKSKYNEGGGGVHRGRELGCPLGELPLHQGKGSPA